MPNRCRSDVFCYLGALGCIRCMVVPCRQTGLGSIPELELELTSIPIPIPELELELELQAMELELELELQNGIDRN